MYEITKDVDILRQTKQEMRSIDLFLFYLYSEMTFKEAYITEKKA